MQSRDVFGEKTFCIIAASLKQYMYKASKSTARCQDVNIGVELQKLDHTHKPTSLSGSVNVAEIVDTQATNNSPISAFNEKMAICIRTAGAAIYKSAISLTEKENLAVSGPHFSDYLCRIPPQSSGSRGAAAAYQIR
jgi:hypothetical protein